MISPEKDRVHEGVIKHKGFFDFKDLYNFLYTFLTEYEYFLLEKKYSEKIKPNGKEIEVTWEARRKISDYFRFLIKVEWFIIGMKDEKEGNSGEIKIKITGYLEKDYEERWESTPLTRFLRDAYERYIIKRKMEKLEYRLIEEVDEAIAQLKSFLSLEGRREA